MVIPSFALGALLFGLGQPPVSDPPRLLPPSITGVTPPPAITPAAGVVPVPAASVPADRFKDLTLFPPETQQALFGVRGAADWLGKVHQSNGRFLPGINLAVAAVSETDAELRQAMGTLALCRAARFTGDSATRAKASQALLTTMAGLKPDDKDPNRWIVPGSGPERFGIAACLTLAVLELPNADARSQALGEHMAAFLRNGMTPTGSLPADALGRALAMQALAQSHRAKPADWKRDAAVAMIRTAAAECKTAMAPALAGGAMAACVDLQDPALQPVVWELAEALCSLQYGANVSRGGFPWSGGFRATAKSDPATDPEPNLDSTLATFGMIAASQAARQSGDLSRYAKYRQCAVEGLMFVRSCQFTMESAGHFDTAFRNRSVIGGLRGSPTDPFLRTDATALALGTCLRFLESGCELRN